jgi:hypothetical protein
MKPWVVFALVAAGLGVGALYIRRVEQDAIDRAALRFSADSLQLENNALLGRDTVRAVTIQRLEDSIFVIGRMVENRVQVSTRDRATARLQVTDLGRLIADSLKPKLDSVRLAYESVLSGDSATIRDQARIIAYQRVEIDTLQQSLAEFRIQLARSLDLNSRAIKAGNRGIGQRITDALPYLIVGAAIGSKL